MNSDESVSKQTLLFATPYCFPRPPIPSMKWIYPLIRKVLKLLKFFKKDNIKVSITYCGIIGVLQLHYGNAAVGPMLA